MRAIDGLLSFARPLCPGSGRCFRAASTLCALLIVLALTLTPSAEALERITMQQAVRAAQSNGVVVIEATADSLAAAGALATARARENPSLSIAHSESPPQYHAALDLPLPFGWSRGARVHAASAMLVTADARLRFQRASVRFAAEAAYVAALSASARETIARADADLAAALLEMTETRRDAGDASDLDVRLARINRGRALNATAADSLQSVGALLAVQMVMGLASDSVTIALADTLTEPPPLPLEGERAAKPWTVVAAEAAAEAASAQVRAERRAIFPAPSLAAGVEGHDPSADDSGPLPMFGVSVPLPLVNRRKGEVATARAERFRRDALLAQARRDAAASVARARRDDGAARARLARDRALLDDAARVVEMSRLAYSEGEAALVAVLEALRSAREIENAAIDDLVAAFLASAEYRVFSEPIEP